MKIKLTQMQTERLHFILITLCAVWFTFSFAMSHISGSYQKAYLFLSQDIIHSLEEINAFEYGENRVFDRFSAELVQLEVESKFLYENIKNNYYAYLPFFNPISEKAVELSYQYRTEVILLTQRIERMLSEKVSLQYTNKTIRGLREILSLSSQSSSEQLIAYDFLENQLDKKSLQQDHKNYFTLLAIKEYMRLQDRVEDAIRHEKVALLDSDIHRKINNNNDYWLERRAYAQVNITLASIFLFLVLSSHLYWHQWAQQYREKKLSAKLLEKERERSQLAMVVEHASDAIIITDKYGKTSWVNRAFEQLSGYTRQEFVGRKPGHLLRGKLTSLDEAKRISEHISQAKAVTAELVNYRKNGQPYWVELAITPVFDTNNQLEQFIAVERETSQRKRLEQRLEDAVSKADESNRAKSTFLATMSHELRTPLNGILGMAQILESTDMNVEQHEQLSVLLESGYHLLSLLNDILDISKIEEGKLELENEEFALDDICAPILSTYSAVCQEKGLTFELENQLGTRKSYRGDKSRIRQVIFNLLGNAVKFTEKGGIKTTFYSEPDLQIDKRELLRIKVEDTGIGIPHDRLNTIFNPFIQAEASTTRKFGGTGLGLAIVKKLAHLMSGDVSVSSKVGTGSQFEISLYLEPINSKRKSEKEGIFLDSRVLDVSLNILLVEDNKVNALVAKTFCSKQGHNVDVAENGQIAVDKVKGGQYDLIIMDNHMPVMDGIEATRIIRQELKSKTLIFGCTADVFKEAHDSFVAAGVNHILTKPLQKESFIDALYRYRQQLTASKTDNVVHLIRHDIQHLGKAACTEAEISLQTHHGHGTVVNLNDIEQFKALGEQLLSALVEAYSNKDKAQLSACLLRLETGCQCLNLNLVESKRSLIMTCLNNNQLPELELMQSLINLLEVNVHEAIRILDTTLEDESEQEE
ncbi:ATP-binding protein [Thaumasiovibrio sp. DFM-14]|uniref:ATP-binding protein n=1 Tax=Thaumasiovibrio sp. DFM-14 TaxID=3384792 RepID=UPI0039A2E6EE